MSTEHFTKSQVEKTVKRIVKPLVIGVLVIFVAAPLLGVFIQFLWNATIAVMFDLAPISFWQAVGLFVLAKLFFGFGGHSDKKQGKSRARVSADASAGEPDPEKDEKFRAYWQAEGKEAYEAFLAKRDESSQ